MSFCLYTYGNSFKILNVYKITNYFHYQFKYVFNNIYINTFLKKSVDDTHNYTYHNYAIPNNSKNQ